MYIGIDIGGTKCAVVLADRDGRILQKSKFATSSPRETVKQILAQAEALSCGHPIISAGISCGGPLDSQKGLILSPPNLPEWNAVPITEAVSNRLSVPAYLVNDANACALAEWKFGAGMGTNNMIFLTFGTGMGAGLILNGKLYEGTNGNAGECGHIRLSSFGPVGYGKAGSFEGFCSGGGLAQIGKMLAIEAIQSGKPAAFCPSLADIDTVTAKTLQDFADVGDPIAIEAYRICAGKLGMGLGILIDILNPEAIVLGSIFPRAEHLIRDEMERVIELEALHASAHICRIVPAKLGESIGDYAAIAIAITGGTEK